MRAGNLIAGVWVVALMVAAQPTRAETKPADPCARLTRKNADRCLGKVLVGATSAEDEVLLDGQRVGKGSVLLRNVPAGKHLVVVKKKGGDELRNELVLAGGGVSVVKPPGATFSGPSAPPIAQGSAGWFDECDGTFVQSSGGTFPLGARDLVELRKTPTLALHLPTAAVILAQPEDACRGGDVPGCLAAARGWEETIGKRQSDPAKAQSFFDKACALGSAEGCVSLGVRLVNGSAGAPDLGKARKLFEKACTASNAEACRRLGDVIAFPRAPATPATAADALPFMKRACELGDREGCTFVNVLQHHIDCGRGDREACARAGTPLKP